MIPGWEWMQKLYHERTNSLLLLIVFFLWYSFVFLLFFDVLPGWTFDSCITILGQLSGFEQQRQNAYAL